MNECEICGTKHEPTFCTKRCLGESAKANKRLIAWVNGYNSHGIIFGTLVFLPEGVEPETKAAWRRMPWLDQPLKDEEAACRAGHLNLNGTCPICGYTQRLATGPTLGGEDLLSNPLERHNQIREVIGLGPILDDGGQLVVLRLADLQVLIHERDEAKTANRANSERALQLQQEREEVKAQRDKAIAAVGNLGADYDLGRADERTAIEDLLRDAERMLSTFIASANFKALPELPVPAHNLLERIQAYRKGTEAVREAGRKRGWYPKESKQ